MPGNRCGCVSLCVCVFVDCVGCGFLLYWFGICVLWCGVLGLVWIEIWMFGWWWFGYVGFSVPCGFAFALE